MRQRPGEWLFRTGALARRRTIGQPDLQLLGGRIGLSWTAFLPWAHAYLCNGDDFDLDAARTRLARAEAESRFLRFAAGALFLWVMGGVTILVLTDRLLPVVLPFTAAALILWVLALAAFFRAFHRIHGRSSPLELALTTVLSPVSLMRAPQTVGTEAIKTLHPVTAGALLLDDAEFVRVGRLWHFDVPHLRPVIERLARRREVFDRLSAPPARWDAGLSRYCPRCHETYTSRAECCADCPGVHLRHLPGTPRL